MGIPGSANPMLFGGAAAYQINQSLRFNSADSAYLNRTPASAGNRKTWTWSGWIKSNSIDNQRIFQTGTTLGAGNYFGISFQPSGTLYIEDAGSFTLQTTAAFRDPSAWYHLVIAVDTTQATASNRIKLYVNSNQITSFSTGTYPSQNSDTAMNNTIVHYIGAEAYSGPQRYLDGYLAEVNLIDGTALTPSSFGETDPDTGAWIPKAYSGSRGTNGFYLKFQSSGIGTDSSGNGNNWTANNFSTSGTGTDVMSDTPTNNYATLNPLVPCGGTFSEGNLKWVTPSTTSYVAALSSIGLTGAGKVYFEATAESKTGQYWNIGLHSVFNSSSLRCQYRSDGTVEVDGTAYTGYSTYTAGDIIGVTFDSSTGDVSFYKNNSLINTRTVSSLTVPWFFSTLVSDNSGSNNATYVVNFGQRAFAYTPPTGFKALNTANLPEPTIKKGSSYFDTVLYTGNGSTQTISGLNFSPDFVWFKSRNTTYHHALVDAVRGVDKYLYSSLTIAEETQTTAVSSFNSNGFSFAGNFGNVNNSGTTYAAWAWDANGAGSSNTAGSITSTVSANATAGFSIVAYTGNGSSSATVGHGLGVTPSWIIVRNRTTGGSWWNYHASLGTSRFLRWDDSGTGSTSSTIFNAAPTSTVFTVGSSSDVNKSGDNILAYCFSEVAGYSKFGSYTGNGSSDGVFIHLGFKPAFFMWKVTSTTGSWGILDFKRDTYNVSGKQLFPNQSDAEASYTVCDLLSNGIKMRNTFADTNGSGSTYIFAAFAELPQKYSNAR